MIVAYENIQTFQLPTTYTIENKLLSVAIQIFLEPLIGDTLVLDSGAPLKMRTELSTFLFSHFKYEFTKIELIYEDRKLKISIEYKDGLPLEVELKHSQQLID